VHLCVADNGIGFTDLPPNLECWVAAGLAGLLEADLAYDRLAGRTIAEIARPVAALWPRNLLACRSCGFERRV